MKLAILRRLGRNQEAAKYNEEDYEYYKKIAEMTCCCPSAVRDGACRTPDCLQYGYVLEGDRLYFCVGDVSGKGVPTPRYADTCI